MIMLQRLERCVLNIQELLLGWPNVTFRDVSRCLGRILSLHPVFGGSAQLKARMLQTIVNIRHFKNLGWDVMIQSDYAPLIIMAQDELRFWLKFAVEGNKSDFPPPPLRNGSSGAMLRTKGWVLWLQNWETVG